MMNNTARDKSKFISLDVYTKPMKRVLQRDCQFDVEFCYVLDVVNQVVSVRPMGY